mmetsp:Transcript_15803/g.23751  ORF Transcript_15803/g.23751 Transcript_15803/m.23751 type:complete len:308 (+) Transcript_15803:135-1058(+)
MARGSEAKERRKEARKEAREKEKEKLLEEVTNDFELDMDADFPTPTTEVNGDGGEDVVIGEGEGDGEGEEIKPLKKKKRKKTKSSASASAAAAQQGPPPSSQGIKSGPLIMLLMLTGTTLLPALLYAGDWVGGFIQKNHILGSLGHKLNIGSSPRKRVLSFYEKHDPNKIEEVDTILAKYYGDYPKLVKRLERKYGDYGYFINWEQDEAPMTLAFEKLDETKQAIQKEFNKRAPQSIKTAARNMNYNLSKLYRKGRVLWKKKVWPMLEPIFGVPDGAAAQKRKDRAEAQKKKGRRKANDQYRDDEEF